MKDATLSSENALEPNGLTVHASVDVGIQNCATLILNVRLAMQRLTSGDVLEVIAYDPSAQLDLQAWCRLTGHEFLQMAEHAEFTTYYLRKGAR